MFVGVLVLVWAQLCWSADETGDGWTEQQLRQSKEWRDDQAPLILTKPGQTSEL